MTWLKIFCYCCCQRGKGPKLSAKEKRKKWIRLVGVMTLKQYGTRWISGLFYAFLCAEALTSMNSIWKDFREYSDCNNEYTANLTRLISKQYSDAANELATAVQETSQCVMGTLDVKVSGFRVGLGSLPAGIFGDIFGWFSPHESIPDANLNLQSNTEEIMQEVAHDLSFLSDVAWWFRTIGFILTFITTGIILLKATFYTLENLPWKPGVVGLTMRLVEASRVIAVYVVLVGAVYLQAYLTDKSCRININNTVIETPMCEVVGEQCEFHCVKLQQNYTSPCSECNIHYDRWWLDYRSLVNILGAVYLFFIFVVVVVEIVESKKQKKELTAAGLREKEEKERRRQAVLEKKKRREQAKAKKASHSEDPPLDQSMEDYQDVRIDIHSEGETKHRKKSSKHADGEDRPKKKKSSQYIYEEDEPKKKSSKDDYEEDKPKKKSKKKSKRSKEAHAGEVGAGDDSKSQELLESEITPRGPSTSSYRL